MKLTSPITAAELARKIDGELIGDGALRITGLNEIHHVEAGDLCFVDHPRYYEPTLKSAASVILIDRAMDCPAGKALIVTPEPFYAYNDLVKAERPAARYFQNIDPSAEIGEGATFAQGAVAGAGVRVGTGCHIGPNAVLMEGVTLGNDVTIGANTVVGAEAHYFKKTKEGYHSWWSGGAVVIEDGVTIGPNCNIARGVSSPTVIGAGTKIDALVQIGHDCKIGRHCLLAAQVGIAGNTTLGDWCVLGGQVGVTQNLTLGEGTVVHAQSGLMNDTEAGKAYFGSPAQEARVAYRDLYNIRGLRK